MMCTPRARVPSSDEGMPSRGSLRAVCDRELPRLATAVHNGSMSYEKTYVMLKPGVLQRRLVGEIIARVEAKSLKLIGLKLIHISRDLAETHYGEHKGKPFYDGLITYITSGPVVAMVVAGETAIGHVRTLAGATKVEEALPGTIRGDFAAVTSKNIIHASDSPESAEREIGLFFKDEEIIDYEDGNAEWF